MSEPTVLYLKSFAHRPVVLFFQLSGQSEYFFKTITNDTESAAMQDDVFQKIRSKADFAAAQKNPEKQA